MELVDGGYKYWPVDLTHHHSLSLSSLLQRWVRLKVLSIGSTFSHSFSHSWVCYYSKEVLIVTLLSCIMCCLKCQQISHVKKEVFMKIPWVRDKAKTISCGWNLFDFSSESKTSSAGCCNPSSDCCAQVGLQIFCTMNGSAQVIIIQFYSFFKVFTMLWCF